VNNLTFPGSSALPVWSARAAGERVFDIDAWLAAKSIDELCGSPAGTFLAYTASSYDIQKDKSLNAV
jgi:hypothetical protein